MKPICKAFVPLAAGLSLVAAPVMADEVTDTLNSAIAAYEEGDLGYALDEMAYAKQLIDEQKANALVDLLPPAPDGWERTVNQDAAAGMAMFGGGVGTEATYSNGNDRITLTLMSGNQMVMAFGGMIGNAAAMGGKIERVGREKFMLKDGELTGVVDGKVMVQAKGGETDAMVALLEQIDFKALADFAN